MWVSESQQKSGQEPETQSHPAICSGLKLSESSSREKLQFLTVRQKKNQRMNQYCIGYVSITVIKTPDQGSL